MTEEFTLNLCLLVKKLICEVIRQKLVYRLNIRNVKKRARTLVYFTCRRMVANFEAVKSSYFATPVQRTYAPPF